MLTKKELENALKQYEGMLFDSLACIEGAKAKVEFCKAKIAELPEDDPMPEGAKDIVKAVE